MGVYVKGMEMPKRCCECRLSTCHSFKERPLCDVLVKYMSYGEWEAKRLDDCPLVPVPPHGKLIESKAFLKVAYETDDFSLDELAHLAVLVAATPTIIPADDPKEE